MNIFPQNILNWIKLPFLKVTESYGIFKWNIYKNFLQAIVEKQFSFLKYHLDLENPFDPIRNSVFSSPNECPLDQIYKIRKKISIFLKIINLFFRNARMVLFMKTASKIFIPNSFPMEVSENTEFGSSSRMKKNLIIPFTLICRERKY